MSAPPKWSAQGEDGPQADAAIAPSGPEVRAACTGAARGAGLPWGLAEEAGMAAAWLWARGLPGPGLVLALLEGAPPCRPRVAPLHWHGGPGLLCPLATGAALADFAGLPEGLPKESDTVQPGQGEAEPPGLVLHGMAWPGLILPFAATAARLLAVPLAVGWPGLAAVVGPDGTLRMDDAPAAHTAGAQILDGRLIMTACATAALRRAVPGVADACRGAGSATVPRPSMPLAQWRRLERLGALTHVPASARSRAGAGEAAQDSD